MSSSWQEKRRVEKAILMVCLAAAVFLSACGENILPKKGRPAGDGGGRDPQANCVKPGEPANERGIGAYCEKGTDECTSDSGPARFCSADFSDLAPIRDDQWFCSTVCTTDEECGTGAACMTTGGFSGCVPLACVRDASVF